MLNNNILSSQQSIDKQSIVSTLTATSLSPLITLTTFLMLPYKKYLYKILTQICLVLFKQEIFVFTV